MTSAVTKVELYGANNGGQIINYAIANNAAVSKFDILQLLDSRTVSCGHLAASAFRIAAQEHRPNEGVLEIGCFTQGRVRFVASGNITVNMKLWPGGPAENKFTSCGLSDLGYYSGAYSEDTLSDGETGTMRINQ